MVRLLALLVALLCASGASATVVGPPGASGAGDGVGISGVTDDDGPSLNGPNITFTDSATATWTCENTGDTCSIDVVGGGDVTGPVSSTANAIVVWSGTGGDTLLDSAVTIVSGNLTTPGTVEASELISTPHATAGGEFCLTDGVDDGETPWCIKMADSGIDSGTCTRTGATWSGDCPGGGDLDWMYARLAGSSGTEAVATNSVGPFGTYNSVTVTSSSGLIDYAPLMLCTDGINQGLPCTDTSNPTTDCGSGASTGCEEWGGYEINKAGTFEIGANVGYNFDNTLGRYATCTGGGTNDGQRCVAAADCFGGGTCTGETGAVGTIACVEFGLQNYAGGTLSATLSAPPTFAPPGQKMSGANANLARAQFPKSTGRWMVTVSSPPLQIYPYMNKCHASQQTDLPAHTILTGATSLWIEEKP